MKRQPSLRPDVILREQTTPPFVIVSRPAVGPNLWQRKGGVAVYEEPEALLIVAREKQRIKSAIAGTAVVV